MIFHGSQINTEYRRALSFTFNSKAVIVIPMHIAGYHYRLTVGEFRCSCFLIVIPLLYNAIPRSTCKHFLRQVNNRMIYTKARRIVILIITVISSRSRQK